MQGFGISFARVDELTETFVLVEKLKKPNHLFSYLKTELQSGNIWGFLAIAWVT
jgi:hypothetical protein